MDSSALAEGLVPAHLSAAEIASSAPSKGSRLFQKKFEFVVNAGKESRKLVRTHVMRDFWRQQRRQASQIEDPESRPSNGPVTWQWKTIARRKSKSANARPGRRPRGSRVGDGVLQCSLPQEKELGLRLQKRKEPKLGGLLPSGRSSDTFDDCEEVPRPRTFLGAGRVDPFRSHSLDLGYRQHEFLNQYVSMLSFSDCPQDLLNSVVQTVVASPASFHAVLSTAQKASARLQGEPDSLESIWHKGEAMRLTNARLENPALRFSDDTIGAVAQLAFADHAFGNLPSLKIHMDGLEMMIKVRGGLAALTSPTLQSTVAGIDTANAILSRTRLRFVACPVELEGACNMLTASQSTPMAERGANPGHIVVYKPRYECMVDPMLDLYQDPGCREVMNESFVRFSGNLAAGGDGVRTPFGWFYQYADESVRGRQDAFVRQERVRRLRRVR